MENIKIDDYQYVLDTGLDGAQFIPGAHKHGYIIRLNARESGYLQFKGYTLITNGWYSPGDYFEIRNPRGDVMDPLEIGIALKEGGL